MMREAKEFYMNKDTILFIPKCDEYGNLYTCILENDDLFRNDLSPTALMNENLKYYGSNLDGAIAGARVILGKICMSPIVVSDSHGLYWFPSKSHKHKDCAWLALHHIKTYQTAGKKKTLVTFSNGSTYEVGMSFYSFEERVKRTYKLKAENERKMHEPPMRIAESRTEYHFVDNEYGSDYFKEIVLSR